MKVYHGYLASSYHTAIISGFSLISSYLESVASSGNRVKAVVIGLGAGLLPMFLHGCMQSMQIEGVELDPVMLNLARDYFGFTEDKRMKSHKEAAQFRFRTFPYYDQLTTIYARDRATGRDAQTAADVLEEIHADDVRTTDMNEERASNLYSALWSIEGLTDDQRYDALSKIPDHPTQMIVFFSLPSVARLEWVRRFLSYH